MCKTFPQLIEQAYQVALEEDALVRTKIVTIKSLWKAFHKIHSSMRMRNFKFLLLLLHEMNYSKYEFDRGSIAVMDHLRYGIHGRKHTRWSGDFYVYFRLVGSENRGKSK